MADRIYGKEQLETIPYERGGASHVSLIFTAYIFTVGNERSDLKYKDVAINGLFHLITYISTVIFHIAEVV